MRYVNIKSLYKNLSSELQNLPLTITKNGSPIAQIIPIQSLDNTPPKHQSLDRKSPVTFFHPVPK